MLKFKFKVVFLVKKGGQAVLATVRILGLPMQTLCNSVTLGQKGLFKDAGGKSATVEQIELARFRAQLALVTMEHDISKKATTYFPRKTL